MQSHDERTAKTVRGGKPSNIHSRVGYGHGRSAIHAHSVPPYPHWNKGMAANGAPPISAIPSGASMPTINPSEAGFLSPVVPRHGTVSYWGALWNEFLGTLFFGLMGRLFVGVFGGTTFASTIPTLFGTAIANAFAMFGTLMLFGSVSGGHFNSAITLAVMLVELFARFGWFGAFNWESEKNEGRTHPWRTWLGLLPYFLVQFIAYLLSALLIWGFLPGSPRAAPVALGIPFVTGILTPNNTFGVELMGSFLFILAYLLLLKIFHGAAAMPSTHWDQQWRRAASFSLWYFALIVVFARWAGAVWNPTLWLSFALISGRYVDWYVFFWPPLISAIVAAVFCLLHWWIGQTRNLQDLRQVQTAARGTRTAVTQFGRSLTAQRLPTALE